MCRSEGDKGARGKSDDSKASLESVPLCQRRVLNLSAPLAYRGKLSYDLSVTKRSKL